MIESDASFGLHAIVSAAIMDAFMIDEKRLFDYTQRREQTVCIIQFF